MQHAVYLKTTTEIILYQPGHSHQTLAVIQIQSGEAWKNVI